MSNRTMIYDVTMLNGVQANGSGTAFDCGGLSAVAVQIYGMGTATINWEGTINDTTWVAIYGVNFASGVSATTTTADGVFLIPVTGLSQIRARVSGYSSGTITATAKGVNVGSAVLLASSTGITVAQGTAASASGYWPVRNTDGTNLTPAMDSAARRGYQQITDGTNSLPTGDAVGRKIFVAPTDGTNAVYTGAAANMAAVASINSLLSVPPGQWSVTHTPATTVQATASKTAGGGSSRHVCTSISFCYAAGSSAIAAATPLLVNLRDGATGAGTILWSQYVNVPAVAAEAVYFSQSGLAIVGSAATAMTLEFSAGGGTNSYQSVSMTGFTAA